MRSPQPRWNAAQAIVPPGELLLRLLEEPEGILEAQLEQRAKRSALGLREVDLAFPALRVVHVARVGGDVQVTERRRGLDFLEEDFLTKTVKAEYQRSL